ncbi:sialoadhesin-like isoform X2 [Paramormyrops kingsleyae]|uniref:sialoadhesin-like isoform X2 n=1 Tax=Paramormyrops kingsleyae TaxID=1676925 RepID=UPI003B96A446
MWSHNNGDCTGKTYAYHSTNRDIDAAFINRAEFFVGKGKNCSLQIRNITETDAGVYRFRFTTNGCEQCGTTGVTLRVDELQVISSREYGPLREGDSVTLRCDTGSCPHSQSEFTWFKDKQRLSKTQSTLQFKPVCYRHSGKYSCALKGSEDTRSTEVNLNVQTGPWTVHYPQTSLCAVKGSTIIIQCEYDYPQSYKVESKMWSRNNGDCTGKTYAYHSTNRDIDAAFRNRAEFFVGKGKNCSIMIKNIRKTDAGVYRFRFTTNGCEQCGTTGVTLRVDELQVISSREYGPLREGDSVTLTCDTGSCPHSQSEFTWFKDKQRLSKTQSTLQFKPVCYRHSGKYSCALKGSEDTRSTEVNLNVQTGPWTVHYPQTSLCAVKGSTIIIQCKYDYPESYKVESKMWSHNNGDCTGKTYAYHSTNRDIDAAFINRAEFFVGKGKNCSLQIRNITETDAGVYRFRFTTNGCEQCGTTGVTLRVDELQVISSREYGPLREGDSVTLTCDTGSCPHSQSEFTWFKDKQRLSKTQSTLQFKPVCYRHSGKYSCALKGSEDTRSTEVNLNVQTVHYPQTSLCAVKGSTIIIQCEYDYPQSYKVESKMWSRNNGDCTGKPYAYHSTNRDIDAAFRNRAEFFVGKGKNCSIMIKNIRKTDAGVYRFRFTTNGCEQCGTTGVTLRVDELQVISSREYGPLREGDSVTLRCDTGSCPHSQSEFTWFKDKQRLSKTQSTLQFKPVCYRHSGKYSCALKGSEDTRSTEVNLNVQTVHYPQTSLCAVKGSTIIIQCEYDYPQSYKVESKMWSRNNGDCTGKPYAYHSTNRDIDAAFRNRAEFFVGKGKNCSIMIKNIRKTDAGVYRFRFTTNGCEQCGTTGVTLRVDELQVISSREYGPLREGDSVTLTCDTGSCPHSQSEFTWFKDKQRLSKTQSTLQFKPVCYPHSGKYSCALKGSEDTRSTEVNLNVQTVHYPQTSLCAVKGSTIIIQCEYDYPQSYKVESKMWSRNNGDCTGKPYAYHSTNRDIDAAFRNRAEFFVGKGKNCSIMIKNIRKTDAGVYRFRFTTNGCEQCGTTGVTLRVDELQVISSREYGPLREGDSVTLTCDTGSCPHSQSEFTWFKDKQRLPKTQSTLQFKPVCYRHSGKYSCALKGSEDTRSTEVNLNVQTGPWTVHYPQTSLCAVKGSTIIIQCEYDYPESYKVESKMWSHNNGDCTGKTYAYHSTNRDIDAAFINRAEFFVGKGKNCSLQIRNITETDAGVYRFRFTTNGCEQCGTTGVTLRVDELKVVMTSSGDNGTLTEGDFVNLTCDTGICSHNQSKFTWFKDNQSLPQTQSTPVLILTADFNLVLVIVF